MVNTNKKQLRLEIIFERNIEFMKKFVYAHIMPGNIIVTDAKVAYNSLYTENNYIHSVHSHGHGDFGYG